MSYLVGIGFLAVLAVLLWKEFYKRSEMYIGGGVVDLRFNPGHIVFNPNPDSDILSTSTMGFCPDQYEVIFETGGVEHSRFVDREVYEKLSVGSRIVVGYRIGGLTRFRYFGKMWLEC
jgi:hypothetical protein